MYKTILLALTFFGFSHLYAQNSFFVLKKRKKTIAYFYAGSRITFQLTNGQWLTGIITRVDSTAFYMTQEIVHRYMMLADTTRFKGLKIELKNIYAMPTDKEQVSFNSNGEAYITLGHEKFAWVRNGLIFKIAGAGYDFLNITNSLIDKDPPFTQSNLKRVGIGAGLFLVGEILHLTFYPYWRLGAKYHLEYVSLPVK